MFNSENLQIHPSSSPTDKKQVESILAENSFGKYPTDHMFIMRWSEDKGWHDGKITARAPISLDPSATVFHYGQEIFEGMKAYKNKNGDMFLFRPKDNARRFNASAKRLSMANIPEDLFVKAVEELVRIDKQWVSSAPDSSLYLRPFMIASEPFLGVRPAREYIFCVIASPAANYFSNTSKISLWVEDKLVRAVKGGTGEAKCGGNYAGAMEAQTIASANKCDQVVFLDATEHRFIEELGGMNIFFVFKNKRIITPPLSGTILRGITRDSIIKIASAAGYQVEEALYSFDDWQKDAASGEMIEAFACGTAAVVAPIGQIHHSKGQFTIGNNNGTDSVAQTLKSQLVSIQTGNIEDKFEWVWPIK